MSVPRPSESSAIGRVRRPAPLREGVYEVLLELITCRRLPPGHHLVESELAERLGVSRQPVREALQRLDTEGWVELRPGYGAFVHEPTESEAEQLFHVRALLETESARLAAQNAAPRGVLRMRELLRRGTEEAERGDAEAAAVTNAELHQAVTELSGNAVLAELAARVARRVRWYHTSVVARRGLDSWEEHAGLIEAIAAGEPERAARLMYEHTERTRRMYFHPA